MNIVKKISYTIMVFGIFFIPNFSLAVEIPKTADDITVEFSPSNPRPYEITQIKLKSYSIDLNQAKVEWKSGSSIVSSGLGKTSYSFRSTGPNSITIFDITITLPEGNPIQKRVAINPTETDLLYESIDGYTPPFYKGASLITPESVIKVVAIPNTDVIKQGKGSVTYTWRNDDKVKSSASGYNKDSYTFPNDNLNSLERISVDVSTVGGKFNSSANIEIPILKSKVLFYKKSPTEGVLYNQSLNTNSYINEEEATIIAIPFFLPIQNKSTSFNYLWKVNGEDIDTPSNKTEITIRPSSRGGYATIGVTFENMNSLFQRVVGQLKINL